MIKWFSISLKGLIIFLTTATILAGSFILNSALANVALVIATGGSAISADTAGGSYTSLSSPVLTEGSPGDIGMGTLVLNAPTGFSFRTTLNSVKATVTSIGTCTGSGNKKLKLSTNSGSLETVTPTASSITITIAQSSANNCKGAITWSGIAVRPTSGAPLVTGNITKSGTSAIAGISGTTNFGTLTEVAGMANKLSFQQQPTNTIVGDTVTPAVTVQIQDQFGNLTNDTFSIILTIGANPSSGILSGGGATSAIASTAIFSNLNINKAGNNYTLIASSRSSANTTSNTFNVTKKSLAVTATGVNKIYDGNTSATVILSSADPVFGDNVNFTHTDAAFDGTDVGTHVIHVTGIALSGTDADNYALSNTEADTSANITVKAAVINLDTDNLIRIYGATPQSVDVLSTDPADLVYLVTYNGSSISPTSAGSYDVIAAITDPNYSGTAIATLTINKADQTITFGGLASRSYGDPNFDVSATTDSGLNVSFTASDNCAISGSAIHLIGSGSCKIKASQPGNDNYNPASDVEQTFTIAKRPISIKADAKSKAYGNSDPALSYQIASGSFAFSDGVSGILSRTSGESVGIYSINIGALTASSSYDLTFMSGIFTITIGSASSTVPMLTTTNPDGSLLATVPTTTQIIIASDSFSGMVNIPTGTEMVGPSSWDGNFILPTVTTEYVSPTPPVGFTTSVLSAIAIGAGNTPLTLNQAARIIFTNQAGKLVGWSRNSIFTEVTNICSADSQTAGDALLAESDCKIDSGSDLVVWTKHFTTYIIYNQIVVPSPSPSPTPSPTVNVNNGGGSGGGSGPASSTPTPAPLLTPTPAPTSTPALAVPTTTPIVKAEKKVSQQIKTETLALVANSPSPSPSIAEPNLSATPASNINNANLLTAISSLFKDTNLLWLLSIAAAVLLIIRFINYRKKSN